MTTPSAARVGRYGARFYPIPRPGSLEIVELNSVSGILDLLAKPALERWRQAVIAEQFALRHDLVLLAANPDTRRDAIKQALDATRANANRGTGLHYLTEMVDNDTLDMSLVPEPSRNVVANYAQAKEDHGWKLVRKEFTVFNHEVGYAGTSDRFLTFRDYDGTSCGDIKTGSGVYPDHGLQMAFYVNADGIWVPPYESDMKKTLAARAQLQQDIDNKANVRPNRRGWSKGAVEDAETEIQEEVYWPEYAELGEHVPMPEDLRKDICFVMHLTDDETWQLVPLNIAGLQDAVIGLGAVNAFQRRKDIVGEPLKSGRTPTSAPPEGQKCTETGTEVSESVAESVKNVPSEDELEPFPAGTPVPVAETIPRPERVMVYRDRIAALSTEAKRELAFNWPGGVPTFKQSDDQTDEQLELVDKLLWKIECEFAPSSADTQAAIDKVQYAFPGSSVTTA